MIAVDSASAAVFIPEQDLAYVQQQKRSVDLTRIQQDIELRKLKAKAREEQAQKEKLNRELDGCTFAPRMATRKKSPDRDLNRFLEDQERFQEEKRMKQVRAKETRDLEEST